MRKKEEEVEAGGKFQVDVAAGLGKPCVWALTEFGDDSVLIHFGATTSQ